MVRFELWCPESNFHLLPNTGYAAYSARTLTPLQMEEGAAVIRMLVLQVINPHQLELMMHLPKHHRIRSNMRQKPCFLRLQSETTVEQPPAPCTLHLRIRRCDSCKHTRSSSIALMNECSYIHDSIREYREAVTADIFSPLHRSSSQWYQLQIWKIVTQTVVRCTICLSPDQLLDLRFTFWKITSSRPLQD